MTKLVEAKEIGNTVNPVNESIADQSVSNGKTYQTGNIVHI
jgi:hypothetical protein